MDTLTKEQRARCMSRVRGKDTTPELIVRRALHGMGFRYGLHSKRLPGKPDIVLTRHRRVVFVHGCFWHGHRGCRKARRSPAALPVTHGQHSLGATAPVASTEAHCRALWSMAATSRPAGGRLRSSGVLQVEVLGDSLDHAPPGDRR